MSTSSNDMREIARKIRVRLVELSHAARAPHLGSSLSCVDMAVAAYWGFLTIDPTRPDDPDRDRFILSKGHAATTLYAILAEKGFFPAERLETFNQFGSLLAEHPPPHGVPGVECATGSLGHGLPIGVGMALAATIQKRNHRVLALLSDGECNEGSVWEAAMTAPARGLNRLTVMIDFNKWQATGRSREVLALDPLRLKWRAFGWAAEEVDGHDVQALADALNRPSNKPKALICHTVKGKGVSFMEDDNNWHYRIPTAEEVETARRELLA